MFLHSLQHGPSQAIFAAIKLVEEAEKSIIISTYVLEAHGHAGKCLMDALIKTKATKIKILTNYFFLFSKTTYNYLSFLRCQKKMKIRVWKHSFMNSNHAKFVIIDGIKCSLGGYNFQESLFMPKEIAWNDLGMVISSMELSLKLKKYFKMLWLQSKKIKCDLKVIPSTIYECPTEANGRILELKNTEIKSYGILTQLPKVLFLHSNKSESFQLILKCFESAQNKIDILSPNVIDLCIWNVLISKLKTIKHFQVRIVTNYGHNHSQSFAILMQKETDFFCTRKKKYIKNLHIRFANGLHKNSKHLLETDGKKWPTHIDHSKYFDVDNKHFYIGSFNMDAMSLHACGESGIIIYDEEKIALQINRFLFDFCFQKAIDIEC